MSELNVREILEKIVPPDEYSVRYISSEARDTIIDKAVSEILQAFRDAVNECYEWYADKPQTGLCIPKYPKKVIEKQEILSLLKEQKGGRG